MAAGTGVALLFLLLLELVASLLPLDRYESGVLAQGRSLFVPGVGERGDRFVTNPHFERYSSVQSFARRKPAGVTRVFLLGGSAALGWPLGEECSATGLLRRGLEEVLPGRFEVINAAVMSFGSHRVRSVLRDVVELDPDVVVLWSGNNEYVERNVLPPARAAEGLRKVDLSLRRLHLYRAMRIGLRNAAPTLFQNPSGPDLTDPAQNPRVVRGELGRLPDIDVEVLGSYRTNLAEMAGLLASRGIPAIFCTVPVNLSGWAPQSTAPQFETAEAAEAWRSWMNDGVDRLDGGDGSGAELRFESVLDLTPRYALGSYFLGMARQRIGDLAGAYESYQRARDDDARVLRALGAFNRAIRELAATEAGVELLDLEEAFREASGSSLVGTDLFLDYCHPTLEGHKVAARALLPLLSRVPGTRALPLDQLRDLVSTAECPPQSNHRRAAFAYALGMTHANNGLSADAEAAYREAIRWRPDFTEALSNLALLLLRRGVVEEAEELSLRALEADPDNVGALLQLGTIRLQQGRLDAAQELIAGVVGRTPEYPLAHEMLGDVAARRGSWRAAIGHYERALELGGEHFLLRRKLGDAYRSDGGIDEARGQWRLALELDPLDRETRQLLEGAERAPAGRP